MFNNKKNSYREQDAVIVVFIRQEGNTFSEHIIVFYKLLDLENSKIADDL